MTNPIPYYERDILSFKDEIITRSFKSIDKKLWYAVLDVGEKGNISDPVFCVAHKKKEIAIELCARWIKTGIDQHDKAPKSWYYTLEKSLGSLNLRFNVMRYWEEKEAKEEKWKKEKKEAIQNESV